MDKLIKQRLLKLSTTNIADALDFFNLPGATFGIRPMWESVPKIAGQAVTIKITAAGTTKSNHHLGVMAISIANKDDIILIDNNGRLDTSCWGGILATAAKGKSISGVVIDGACRDLDDCILADFPVYARGTVVSTARGRIMEEATNIPVQFCGVKVNPGDFVVGDKSGIVIIPKNKIEAVLSKAEELFEKEERMIADIKSGMSIVDVDVKYNYEKMLGN